MTTDEDNVEWTRGEDDELVRRLRGLQWPDVSPELRQRCWEEFSRRMADRKPTPSADSSTQSTDLGEKHESERDE